MATSLFIARLLGPLIAIVSVALLGNPENYRAILNEFIQSPALCYLAGFFGLLGGIALILVHNVWVADWRLVITLIGWVTIVRAVMTIFWPRWIPAIGKQLLESRHVLTGTAVVGLILGAVLSGYGYLGR